MKTSKEEAFSLENLLKCEGFDPDFLGKAKLGLTRILRPAHKKLLPKVQGDRGKILKYSNISIAYNSERKVPFFSAYNLEGSSKAEKTKRTTFRIDPRISADIQLTTEGFYALLKEPGKTEFEVGHMAANDEMSWGEDAQIKSYRTFFYPNSCPQAERLNSGLWRSLESYIVKEAVDLKDKKRISVFTGPILTDDDPVYKMDTSFKVPLLFFKVVVFPTKKGVFCTAFIMSHEQKLIEDGLLIKRGKEMELLRKKVTEPFSDFPYRKVFQVSMKLLTEQTGLNFKWKGVTEIPVANDKNQIQKIKKVRNADDAKKLSRSLTRGIVPTAEIEKASSFLSEKERKAGDFSLNIILP